MTRRIFNVSQPIVFPDGTMQYSFRDFISEVDSAINNAAVTAFWGSLGGSLSNQTDLQSALDGKATTAQGALADTAVQPGDNVSDLTNDANYVSTGDNVSGLTNDAGYLTEYAPPAVRDEATDPYTLVIGDANTVIRFTAASAAVTIPAEASVNFPTGTEVSIRQAGTGTLALTTTGLTINGTVPSWAQHVEVKFRKVGSDTWDVV
jgi:hypothetical protein